MQRGAPRVLNGGVSVAINKAARLALKALSYPDIDLHKVYKLQRSLQNLKASVPARDPYRMWDKIIDAGDHKILTRIYEPDIGNGHPPRNRLLLFFHGGGWVTENVDTYNEVCVALADNTGCLVASVEYRLAPEFPFPAGLDDCYAVAMEMLTNPIEEGITAEDIVLVGDSAGGNFASVVSMMVRDSGIHKVNNQILIYPATWNDHTENSPYESVRTNGYDYLLTSRRIEDYMDLYVSDKSMLSSPLVAPLLASDFSDMPRTLVVTAEFDPLRDEGEAYAKKLSDADNDVTLYRMKDALHGFFALGVRYPQVRRLYRIINRFLDGMQSCEKRYDDYERTDDKKAVDEA